MTKRISDGLKTGLEQAVKMERFGDIPDEVLALTITDFDDNEIPLSQLICEATPESIVSSKYYVSTDEDGVAHLESFSAWTKNYILVLMYTHLGHHLFKHERDPE